MLSLLIALGIGALIGFERQQSESAGQFAGVRTFPLIALVAALTQLFFPAILPIVFALFLVLVIVAYISKIVIEGDAGMTTAVATILTFIYGAMTVHSEEGFTLAIVLGVMTAAILAIKDPIHELVARIGPSELRATLKVLIIALVVLPLLPDRELEILFGLNPRFVWLMVVFVSALGFTGYALTRAIGPHRGIVATGFLGGFVSSTATAMAMAEHARRQPELTKSCALATVIASVAMFPRVLILLAVVAPELIIGVGIPLGAMMIVGVGLGILLAMHETTDTAPTVGLGNPFRVKPALVFGVLFAAVLLGVDLFNAYFGEAGVYLTAIVAGTVDANAITLSLGRLAEAGDIASDIAIIGVVLAVVINTVVKIGIATVFGTLRLGAMVGLVLGLSAITGVVVVVFL